MLLSRSLALVVFSCLVATTLGAEIKRERREATFGAIVGGLASPFINFKRGVLNLLTGSSAQKKPAKQAPKPSYGAPAPSYNAPAPSYNAPVAPSYSAPAPAYQAPYQAPAPSYSAPAPAYDPPALKPEIQILPAPDLSGLGPAAAPAVDTYGSPAAAPVVDTYGSPAAAPAVDTYGSPAAAPAVYAYDAPVAAPVLPQTAVDSYGSPVLPTYVVEQVAPEAPALAPVYEPAQEAAPVYEPATYEPAPVEFVPIVKEIVLAEPAIVAVVEPVAVEPAVPAIVDVVEVRDNLPELIVDLTTDTLAQQVEPADVVDLKTVEVPVEEAREPKAFSGNQPKVNQLQSFDEKPADGPIIIDLTDSFADTVIPTENVEIVVDTNEALVIEEVETEKPVPTQIITFEAVEEIPAISGPVQSSDEVISFSLQQDSQVRNIDFTAVQNDAQVDTFTAAPIIINLAETTTTVPEAVESTTKSETTLPEAVPTETVTPIVPNQELRSLVVELDSAPLEIADIEVVDFNDVEIIDLRTDKKSSGLTIVDHDADHPEIFVVVDETTTTAIPITTQAQEILDFQEEELAVDVDEAEIILQSDTDFSLVNEVESEQILEEIVATKEPELRRVTFQILSDEEAKNVNPEVTFRIVDAAEANENTFDTFRITETTSAPIIEEASPITTNFGEIPSVIGSDPVFQEIINSAEDSENVKRGFNQYDPRHSQVYAHKYNDKYSNWYYFRKGY